MLRIRKYIQSFHNFCSTSSILAFYSHTGILVALCLLEETSQVDALGALNGEAESTVPDELGQGTQTARDTKGGSVVQGLVEAVVVEQDTRAAVNVRVRVLGLAVLLEHLGGDAAVLLDQLENGVLGNLGASGGIVHQSLEARVGLAEHSVAIAGDDTARVERGPEVLLDILLSVAGRDVVLHLKNPAENLLGGKAVERTSQTLETGTVGEERVAQSATNQVGGVGRDVATLVVTVKGEVETEQVLEVLILLAGLAEHGSKVIRPVLLEVNLGGQSTAALVGVLVDLGSDRGQLGQQRDGVIKGRLPVIGLVETSLVRLGKLGLVVERRNGHGELGHGVQVAGELVKHLGDELGDSGLLGKLAGEDANLVDRGDLAGKQKPEHGLGQHLGASLALGQLLLAVLDCAAVETDALVGVEDGTLPDHGLQSTHTTEGVFDLDLANDLVTVSLDLLEELALLGNDLLEGGLQIGLGRGIAASAAEGSSGKGLLMRLLARRWAICADAKPKRPN